MDAKKHSKYWSIWCRKYDPENLELKYVRQLADIKDKVILEIGCGNGRFTRILAKYAKKVVAIDNDKNMISSAKTITRRKNITYKHMDALKLDLKEESFDVVIFTWTLVCILKKEVQALRQAKKVLKSGGKLILVEPGGKSDYGTIVKPHIDKRIEQIDIVKSYEEPLIKVFRKEYQKIGAIRIPYVFDNHQQAFDVLKFAIEEWHKSKLEAPEKLMREVKKYDKIYESVLFYEVTK